MFTVVVNGGLTVAALKSLKIQMGYIEQRNMSQGEINFGRVGVESPSGRRLSGSERKKKLRHLDSIIRFQAYLKAWKYNSSFEVLDRKYLMPFFTLQTEYGNGSRGYSKMQMDVELTDQGKEDDDQAYPEGEDTSCADDNDADDNGADDVEIQITRRENLPHVQAAEQD